MKITAEEKIVGRLASYVAEKVKNGEEVEIYGCEEAVISGDNEEVIEEYRQKYERGSKYRGPYYPKRPDKILKRIIRGMIPEGDEYESRVMTYIGEEEESEDPGTKEGKDLKTKNYVKLGEVSKAIGWKKVEA